MKMAGIYQIEWEKGLGIRDLENAAYLGSVLLPNPQSPIPNPFPGLSIQYSIFLVQYSIFAFPHTSPIPQATSTG